MDRNFRRSPARLASIAARKQSPARPKSPSKSKSPARSKSPVKSKSPAKSTPVKSKSPSRGRPKSPTRGKSPAKKSPARKPSKSPARKPKTPTKSKSESKSPTKEKKPPKKVTVQYDDSDSETSSVSVEPMKLDPKVEAVAAEVSQLPYRRSVRQVIKQIAGSDGKLKEGVNDEVKEILRANNVRTSAKGSSPKGYEVLFKFLLYFIVFPGVVTLTHLSCSRAESCKLWPARFPQTWRYFFNLDSTLIFLGFVVWQFLIAILPVSKKVSGISESLEYRLSGLLSAFLTLSVIGALRYFKYPVLTVLERPMPLISTSYVLALLVSIALFVKGGRAARKSLNPKGNTGNKINDFLVGRELNPRINSWLKFDFKLFFKRHALLTALVYNALTALKIYEANKTLSGLPVTAVTIIALQTLFILDSLWFEDNFLTTFEHQVEGAGFSLVVYYTLAPFIFTTLVKYLLISKVEKSPYVLGAIVVFQLIGYLIYRASNYQKNEFRKNPLNPRASALETIPTVQGRKLIVSGLWGKLRHPNYLGQLIIEWSWAFAADFKLWVPFVSAILLTVTLIYRAIVVNTHNKSVYGTSWDRYTSRVKYSLIPKVF